ncbi:glycosyltransferase family 4 protein [Micromonospora peucetia]|uniref:Glycosyltransferase family 4 protein n=1 Tax=Micromonospora peucetia TaxID=47871 RepID=A0A1C6W654_9ACTN|nr:glycosyltransferase family 4 protein [Micromonospora peucetia]WSA33004.1 glycosyltransferase family 4 protein [Micromonospora peucetia]SCL74022.1 Glycosyltransferase involved in cell wall bisynthesis [Micromonospora peucetia]
MEPGSASRPTRGRIVMLVDNGVQGDSRVQKTARSAAEAGWEVLLLGVLSNGAQESWRIGDAQVRLIRVPRSLGQHPSQFHRSWRRPLAYPPGRHGGYRVQRMKAWQAAIEERRVARAVARRSGGASLRHRVADLLAPPALLTAKALGRWAKFRAGELHRLRKRQQDPDALFTRTPIRFWQALLGPRSWRRLDRGLWDYELAFGPVIDELRPDIIHANDFRMIGVGVRATRRGRARGLDTRLVWDAHEFVGGVLGRADNPRWLPAQVAHVEEYVGTADAVVTVSATLAELLQRTHRLPVRPDVVLNAPPRPVAGAQLADGADVRARCRIDAATPLLVYCGGVNPTRGVELMIDALPQLPGTHVALVTLHPTASNAASEALLARAVAAGVADRVHLLPYVPHWQVPTFLAGADAGVIPIHHQPNHELALITKFLEYSHARLPIVVSDVRTMADTVKETGQGEVFRAEDLTDYVRAVRAVLADPGRYRAAYDRPGLLEGWTWETQVEVLEGVYRRVRPDLAPSFADRTVAVAG